MAIERTLAIVKPDGMKHLVEILGIICENDLLVEEISIHKLSEDVVDNHYAHLLDKEFYPKLRDYMLSGEVAVMILSGDNAVEVLRNMMGPTDSNLADKDTIRGRFGTDITYNAIHGSDSIESAEQEIERFFPNKGRKYVLKY